MTKLIPVVLLVCLTAVGACDNRVESEFVPPPIASTMFVNLSAGEEIEADLRSSGCFHHSRHRFRFHVDDVILVSITEIEETWSSESGGWVEGTHTFLGSMELTMEDLERLDNLVEFYQQLPDEQGCTTVDGITFKLSRDGELVEESSYNDGTCANSGDDTLSFWTLVARITDPLRDILE